MRSPSRPQRPRAVRDAGQVVDLQIESLAHGGESVAHHNGLAVFIPGGVPGDRVRASVHAQGRMARGQLLSILEPSPHRQHSDCPLHLACGGCPWIEVSTPIQLQAKQQVLHDALTRLGHLSLEDVEVRPAVKSPLQTRYRHRARLHVERREGRRVLGFLPAKGRGVVHVESCQVLETPLERALPAIHAALRLAPVDPDEITLSCEPQQAGGRVGLYVEASGRPEPRPWHRVVDRLVQGGIHAVEIVSRGKTLVATRDVRLRHAVAPGVPGGPYVHDASCFTQGNRLQNEAMQKLVMDGLQLTGTETVLELHSGCGNFTLAVGQRAAHVLAVEREGRSTEYARENVERAGLRGKVQARAGNADSPAVATWMEGKRVDCLLLDPPRTGAPGMPALCNELKPNRVVYVSCNPATLARDLSRLVPLGYLLKSVQVVDLFPRTWHVETVAVLERAPGRV